MKLLEAANLNIFRTIDGPKFRRSETFLVEMSWSERYWGRNLAVPRELILEWSIKQLEIAHNSFGNAYTIALPVHT